MLSLYIGCGMVRPQMNEHYKVKARKHLATWLPGKVAEL